MQAALLRRGRLPHGRAAPQRCGLVLPSRPHSSCHFSSNRTISLLRQHARHAIRLGSTQGALRPKLYRCHAAAAELEQQGGGGPIDSAEALSNFLGWLVSNGVTGLGTAQSKVGLYEGETGERGFVCTQDITAGEELFRVPLRLALTAYEDDPHNQLLYEGAPWSVQLSAKLLREVMAGPQSPWWPYLQVLPAQVPAPLETFSWEDMQHIQYGPGQTKLYEYQWLVTDAFSQCSPEALGGASEEQFQWAMSIVHSRTFGNASQTGGVGVHMLVPLVDMLNHGGDETCSGLLGDPNHEATDNVRWDVVRGEGDAWDMVVSATADVAAGDQLLLSYGERCSDDFFIHYGFVPTANPQETVQLFGSLAEALDWHYQAQAADGQAHATNAEQLYRTALDEAVRQQRQQQQQDSASKRRKQQSTGISSSSSSSSGKDDSSEQDGKPVLVYAGGRVDPSLMLAWGSVYAGNLIAAAAPSTGQASARTTGVEAGAGAAAGAAAVQGMEAAAGSDAPAPGVQQHCLQLLQRRCQELLRDMPTSLLQDVALLWADAAARGEEEVADAHLQVLEYYRNALQGGGSSPSAPTTASVGPSALLGDNPIQVFAWQTYQSARQAMSQASTHAPILDARAVDAGASSSDGTGTPYGTSSTSTSAAQPGNPVSHNSAAEAGHSSETPPPAAEGSGPSAELSAQQQLLLRYRVAKKMVLTDAVLATTAAIAAEMAGKPA